MLKNYFILIKEYDERYLRFFLLIIISLLAAFSETLSVSVIIPILLSLTKEEIIRENIYFKEYLQDLFPNSSSLLFAFIIFAAVIHTLKTLIIYINIKYQSNYVYNVKEKVTSIFFQNYLQKESLSDRNEYKSKIITDLTIDSNIFVMNYLLPVLQIITESFLIITMVIFLGIINLKLTILSGFGMIIVIMFTMYWFTL